MKKLLLLSLAIIAAAGAFAAKGYIITQKYTSKTSNTPVIVTWYITAGNCKMKMQFGDGKVNSTTYFIPDAANGELLMYNDGAVPAGSQKSYFKISADKINTSAAMKFSRVSVSKTGETKSVAGMQCEKVTIKTDKGETEMWVTKDFKPEFYKYFAYFRDNMELMGLSEEKITGFPLASETKDVTGKITSSLQAITATAADIADSEFVVPAEYKLSQKN